MIQFEQSQALTSHFESFWSIVAQYSEVLFYIFSCLFTGKEFEVLIDSHGPEHVTQLMQKVISALEHLESLSATRDQEKETIENLRTTISHLEIEDTKKNEEKHRNAKVIEFYIIHMVGTCYEAI